MKYQVELSIVGACGGYSKIPAKHAPAVGNSVLNSPINNLGSGSDSKLVFNSGAVLSLSVSLERL
jgi:hypothetical protein